MYGSKLRHARELSVSHEVFIKSVTTGNTERAKDTERLKSKVLSGSLRPDP